MRLSPSSMLTRWKSKQTYRVTGCRAYANGAVVKAQLDGGTLFDATVRAVIPDEDPLTRTRKVRLQADFTGRLAGAVNQSITVLVPVGEPRDVLSVHKDALIARRGGQMVFVFKRAKRRLEPCSLAKPSVPALKCWVG